jgi:hypothetical protein
MKKVTENFVWEDFKVDEIEKKHKINERAKRDGSGEQPPENDKGLSAVENEISLESSKYLEDHTSRLRVFLTDVEDNQNQLSSYLNRNHFESDVNTLEADFNTIANKKKLTLSEQHNEYVTYQEEKEQFKKINQTYREPNSADKSKTIKSLLLIGGLLTFEIAANSTILGSVLIGGPAEGFAVSAAVAFLNVVVSCLVGYNIVKNVNHIEKQKRIFYGSLSILYLTIITYINLGLGAYRSVAGSVADAKRNRIPFSPEEISAAFQKAVTFWNVDFSFTGIILTMLGLSFAMISILDGLIFNDTYPGYGKVGQKTNRLKNLIRKEFHSYSKDVSELFSKCNKFFQEKFKTLLDIDLINWDSNTNLIQKEFITYIAKVNDLEEKTQHIIGEYRNVNTRVRENTVPSYFAEKFVINPEKKDPAKVFSEISHAYMEDKSREESKIKFSESINAKFKEAEDKIEKIQKSSENIQQELHEKYNIN